MAEWDNPVPGVEPFNANTLRVIFASLRRWSQTGVGEPGYYGSFYSAADQPLASTTASQIVNIASVYGQNGVSLTSNRVVLDHAGVYTMTALMQVKNEDNTPHDCTFWLRLNGVDYPHSAVFSSVAARKNATDPAWAPVTVTFTGEAMNSGDYVEIYWHGSSTLLSLDTQPVGSLPTHPEAPSVVVSVTQVMSTQVGPQGPAGVPGPQGATGPTGPMGGTLNIDGGDPSSIYGGILPLDAGGV